MESSPGGWEKHVIKGSYLEGLTDIHKARIEALQPFNGVRWAATLRDLSNPDKHRRLSPGEGGIGLWISSNAATKAQTIGVGTDNPVDVKIDAARHLLHFEGGERVVETLKELEKQVIDVIDAFEPEFQ